VKVAAVVAAGAGVVLAVSGDVAGVVPVAAVAVAGAGVVTAAGAVAAAVWPPLLPPPHASNSAAAKAAAASGMRSISVRKAWGGMRISLTITREILLLFTQIT
jgi:hypothetical protein